MTLRTLSNLRSILWMGLWLLCSVTTQAATGMADRVQACTHCHGQQGRAGPDGFYPRLAGKPAGYLHHQLQNFRDGRRQYGPMASLVAHLDDTYLADMAAHFAAQEVPYPPPVPTSADATTLARGEALARRGDPTRRLPACAQCHGAALTGVLPAIPGLLGLPRDYLTAQLGAWQQGLRRAHAPDCMADIARQLSVADVGAVTAWLAAQSVPASAKAVASLPQPLPQPCGAAAPPPVGGTPPPSPLIQRGAYLAQLGNCVSCHTARGGVPHAGGRAIVTPFGAIYSSNLTPDADTGLGRWTADDFWRALHQGQSRDGRWLYPAFPYPNYTQVSRADSDALWAYFKSLPPTRQTPPANELRWPFNTQAALGLWRWWFFKPGEFQPDPARTVAWNRGAYLVRGLGHCSACHEARNWLGASTGLELSGGLMPVQNWLAPSLRDPAQAGVMHWSVADIAALLTTGVAPAGRVQGPMAEVVSRSTRHLTPADAHAMATFLKSLPEVSPAAPTDRTPPSPSVQQAGQRLYTQHCQTCHGAQGQGQPGAYPALAGNRLLRLEPAVNLVRAIALGGFGPSTPARPQPHGMPPFAQQLSDADIALLANHLRERWGRGGPPVAAHDVARYRTGADH